VRLSNGLCRAYEGPGRRSAEADDRLPVGQANQLKLLTAWEDDQAVDERSLALISAAVASAIGGLLALGGVVVQERLAVRRQVRQSALEEAREAARRKLERRIKVITETKEATDGIYALISAWAFSTDPDQLRQARAAVGPADHPRADWLYIDNDAAMIEMFEVTQTIFESGRGAGDWGRDAPHLLVAYNRMGNALIRQEDRLEDGMADLPVLDEPGQDAFMHWIPIIESMRISHGE
jgi:hypothetical protein